MGHGDNCFDEDEATEAADAERFFPVEFEVWQGDEMVASASGPRDTAMREAMHYAAQYEQDGPVRVFEVTRTLVRPNVELTGSRAALLPVSPATEGSEVERRVGGAMP